MTSREPIYNVGAITVANGKIVVHRQRIDGRDGSTCEIHQVNIEALAEAVRILAEWMDIPWKDVTKECQRVSKNDQMYAELRDIVEKQVKKVLGEWEGSGD